MSERKIIKRLAELNAPLDKLLVIPSYHKGNLLPRFKNTFMYLDKGITFPILLFLQDKQDVEQYSWVREDIIFWCPEEPELVDIAKVRWYIVEMCKAENVSVLWMLDDDQRFAWRNLPDSPTQYVQLNDAQSPGLKSTAGTSSLFLSDFFNKAEEELELADVAVVGMPARFGSMNIKANQYNRRLICVYGIDVDKLKHKDLNFDPFQVLMEDFDFSCAIAYAHYRTVLIADWVRDGRENAYDEGGCNSYRTDKPELMAEMCERLRKHYPNVVTPFFDERCAYAKGGTMQCRIDWKTLSAIAEREE